MGKFLTYTGFISLIIFLLLNSCTQSKKIQLNDGDLSNIYNPSRSNLNPLFNIHNINDSSSIIYLRISPSELLFSEANEMSESRAILGIEFSIFHVEDNSNNLVLRDSASFRKFLYRKDVRTSYFTALPLKAYFGSRYIIEIIVKDVTRGNENRKYLVLDKKSRFSSPNFRVIFPKSGYPSFTDVFPSQAEFKIEFNQLGYDSIYVDYYSLDRTLPRPIFSAAPNIQMKTFPDSSYALPYNDSMLYSLPRPGIFNFKMEKDSESGCTLYNFGNNFPQIQEASDLLGPLVYLASTAEFRDLRLEPNRKLAIDNYWLTMANDMDDARELIRVYYNRVLYSNLYFTSYKEGWKTDRGMIYIVFGPPDMLEKFPDEEIWKYRTRKSNTPLEFKFKRKDNPFSYEDYQLDRSSSSTSIWLEAVQSWKRGKIYSAYY